MKKFESPSNAPREAAESTGQRPGEAFANRLAAQVERHDAARDAERQRIIAEVIERERPLFERCQAAADTMSAYRTEHLAFIRTLERVPWSQLQRSYGFTIEMLAKSAKNRLDQCVNGLAYVDGWSHVQAMWRKIQAGALGLRVIGPAGTGWQVLEEWRVATAAFVEQPVAFSTAMTSLTSLVTQLDTLLSGIEPEGETVIVVRRQPTPPLPAGDVVSRQDVAEL